MFIYKLVNNIDSRFYVGQSKNIEKRFVYHLEQLRNNRHHNIHLQRFYDLHKDNIKFSYEIVFESDDKNIIDEYEVSMITETYDYNFNLSKKASGGDLISYHPNKDEITSKISNAVKTRNSLLTEEEKLERWSRPGKRNYNYKHGKTLIPIFCNSCNKKLKTKYIEDKIYLCTSCFAKTRTGDKNPFHGKSHSEEFKKRLSEMKKGIPNTHDSKRVEIDGIIYNSYTDASKKLNCAVATISNRIRSDKFPNYKNID